MLRLCFPLWFTKLSSKEDDDGNDEEIRGTTETRDQTQEDDPLNRDKRWTLLAN